MATTELVIALDARMEGLEATLKRVNSRLADVERSAQKSSRVMETSFSGINRSISAATTNLQRFVLAYAGLRGIEALGRLAFQVDDLAAAIRRVQIITGSTAQSAQAQFSQLARTAAQTGQSVLSMVDQFQRFSVATASIGATNSQIQAFVRTLGQFAQISGQAPQEAANAIVQLGQGLASGRLSGDELRSILENMPLLAREIARELNVSVGELRKMGEEGRLTADNVFPAILRSGARLQSQLEGMPLTLRQAWQVAQDRALTMVQAIDQRIGATRYLADLLQRFDQVSEAIRSRVAGGSPNASPADRIAALGREASEANTRVNRLQQALRDLESGAIAPTPGQAPNQQRNRLRRELQENLAIIERNNREIRNVNDAAAAQESTEDTRRIREGQEARASAWEARRRQILEQADPVLKARREFEENERAIAQSESARLVTALRQGGEAEARVRREIAEERAANQRRLDEQTRKAGSGGRESGDRERSERERAAREATAIGRAENRQIEEIQRASGRGIEQLEERYRSWAATVTEGTRTIRSNYDLFAATIGDNQSRLTTLLTAVRREAESTAQELIRSGEDPQPAVDRLREEYVRLEQQLIATGVPAEMVGRTITEQMERAGREVARMKDKVERTYQDIAREGVKAFADDLAGGLIEFATTGEQKFDELAANFAKNIAKMIVQLQIFAAFRAIFGSSGLNLIDFQRMNGGPVTAGQPYIVGERQPELFVPGSSGYIFPSVGTGGGESTINIYNQTPSNIRTQEATDANGNRLVEIFVEETVRKGLATGKFDPTMRQNFGVTRTGRV